LEAAAAPQIAVNGSGVYFSQSGQSQINAVPQNGGTTTLVSSNVTSCGSGTAFALDDQAAYFWTSNFPCTGSPCANSGMVRYAASSGALSMLVPGSQTLNNSCPMALAVSSTELFWLGSQGDSLELDSAPLTGGVATVVTTVPKSNGSNDVLELNRSMALFVTYQNGPATLQQVSLEGGTAKAIATQLDNHNGGINAFVADDQFVYVAHSNCVCNNNGNSNNNGMLPVGEVDQVALDGSSGAMLAQFSGMVSGMAQDASYVYWATDTTVYKVPKAGGATARISGNLGNGTMPYVCQGDCGTQNSNYVAIAVDGTSVYIADALPNINLQLGAGASFNANAILKAPK
jgi:hypothetical protein